MEIVDANVILRYLLKDDADLYHKAVGIIENKKIFIPIFVIAEIVYVFEKVYQVPRTEIKNTLISLLNYKNITIQQNNILTEGLQLYANKNIDFVDAILVAHNRVNEDVIHSFDKKINQLLNMVK